MRSGLCRQRAAYTLLELTIGLALLGVTGTKAFFVVRSLASYSSDEASRMALEDRADDMLDRITYSLMGADSQSLLPEVQAPLHSQSIRYRVSRGVQNGEVVWGEAERIGADPDRENALVWWTNVGTPDERRVVWTSTVRPFLQGELLNGLDDNGNGLVDEKGISFDLRGGKVAVRLTLGDADGRSRTVERTVEGVVSCRNLVE